MTEGTTRTGRPDPFNEIAQMLVYSNQEEALAEAALIMKGQLPGYEWVPWDPRGGDPDRDVMDRSTLTVIARHPGHNHPDLEVPDVRGAVMTHPDSPDPLRPLIDALGRYKRAHLPRPEKKPDPPAFPSVKNAHGLTKREYFAAHAPPPPDWWDQGDKKSDFDRMRTEVRWRYAYADSMLAETENRDDA